MNPGVLAYLEARKVGKSRNDAVRAHFEVEPDRKKEVIRRGGGIPGAPAIDYAPRIPKENLPNIRAVIQKEERKYLGLLAKAQSLVPNLYPDPKLVGVAELARLWDERGIDPETACGFLGLPCRTDLVKQVHKEVARRQARSSA